MNGTVFVVWFKELNVGLYRIIESSLIKRLQMKRILEVNK